MIYQTKYRQIKQKKGEADNMIKAGFPKCFDLQTGKVSVHCNTCIRRYRDMCVRQSE